jgi:tyrosine-protein phosphatase YwqE
VFSFFKKSLPQDPFPFHELGKDMHSHLIPGVDDGSPDPSESTLLINGLTDLGYTYLITTPHIMQDMYPNSPETLGAGYNLLTQSWPNDIPCRFAAEYFLDDHVMKLVENGEPLLTVSGSKVLVELSFVSRPMALKEMLFNLQIAGYEPILAHPERYTYLHRDPSLYLEIREAGCTFQCNILSFSGYYGDSVREAAEFLVGKNLVDMLGTDLNQQRHLTALRQLNFTPTLRKLMSKPLLNPEL